jgi:Divergent InlB B-repeat domain
VRGSAGGMVTSGPAGISCGSSCSASFPNGAVVTLTAAPGPGARFRSWGGACSGASATCAVTMTDARSVTATFSLVFMDATAEDLLPSGTAIKAIHFTELLAAINATQGSSLGWSGAAPSPGGSVLAIHATMLRQAVGLGAVMPGSVIAAQHINEIRLRVRALE